jgi:hypothetical protein
MWCYRFYHALLWLTGWPCVACMWLRVIVILLVIIAVIMGMSIAHISILLDNRIL